MVTELIDATKVGTVPNSLLQKILKDADFNTFGNTYMQNSMVDCDMDVFWIK